MTKGLDGERVVDCDTLGDRPTWAGYQCMPIDFPACAKHMYAHGPYWLKAGENWIVMLGACQGCCMYVYFSLSLFMSLSLMK